MTREPIILSFSSPKGGVGRTMTASNVAAISAVGCEWAGLSPATTALIDMDLQAPGVQYYDFVSSPVFGTAQFGPFRYRIAGVDFEQHRHLIQWLKQKDGFGLLEWLTRINEHPEINRVIVKHRGTRAGRVKMTTDLMLDIRRAVAKLMQDLSKSGDPLDPLHPRGQFIEVLDSRDVCRLYVLPAGEPNHPSYRKASKKFSWSFFFEYRAGYALLCALYEWMMQSSTVERGTGLGAERILLDSNAGDTEPSIANRRFAHHRVVVTGLNLQNQEGLFSLLEAGQAADVSDIRVVMSQYKGRQLARSGYRDPISDTAVNILLSHESFLKEEKKRKHLLSLLEQRTDIKPNRVFLIDFIREAVQEEYFYDLGSPSWNDLVRLLLSTEVIDIKAPETSEYGIAGQLRVLGEFVGVDKTRPSGPIAAFRDWLAEKIGRDISVTGVAMSHEEIAEIAMSITAPEKGKADSNFDFPRNRLAVIDSEDETTTKGFAIHDFDIVALPVYLIPHVSAALERLDPTQSDVYTEDSTKKMGLDYLCNSILGFSKYGFYHDKGSKAFVGYPLFVDFELLAVNRNEINDDEFDVDYFRYEQRHFRGFVDPADVLAAARAAKKNHLPADRLIMTLKKGHIAQWYEWQTVISMFGGIDFEIETAWDDISRKVRLLSKDPKHFMDTIRATRFYLELCYYAARHSKTADWDNAVRLFYEEKNVGMAFVFPDAIPLQYRQIESESELPFVYMPPPADRHPEECWLLVVPKSRRTDAPPKQVLERLLLEFMAYQNQKRYQELGGLATHRRVLQSVDLWSASPFLPYLDVLSEGSRRILTRSSSSKTRNAAEQIVSALDRLRGCVDNKIKANVGESGSLPDDVWFREDFVAWVEDEIHKEFEAIEKSIRGQDVNNIN